MILCRRTRPSRSTRGKFFAECCSRGSENKRRGLESSAAWIYLHTRAFEMMHTATHTHTPNPQYKCWSGSEREREQGERGGSSGGVPGVIVENRASLSERVWVLMVRVGDHAGHV